MPYEFKNGSFSDICLFYDPGIYGAPSSIEDYYTTAEKVISSIKDAGCIMVREFSIKNIQHQIEKIYFVCLFGDNGDGTEQKKWLKLTQNKEIFTTEVNTQYPKTLIKITGYYNINPSEPSEILSYKSGNSSSINPCSPLIVPHYPSSSKSLNSND